MRQLERAQVIGGEQILMVCLSDCGMVSLVGWLECREAMGHVVESWVEVVLLMGPLCYVEDTKVLRMPLGWGGVEGCDGKAS